MHMHDLSLAPGSRTPSLVHAVLGSFVLVAMAACSGGGGGGTTQQTPTLQPSFDGTWGVTQFVAASNCQSAGSIQSSVVSITQTGNAVTITDADGDLTGSFNPTTNGVVLSRADGYTALGLALDGTGSVFGLAGTLRSDDGAGGNCDSELVGQGFRFTPRAAGGASVWLDFEARLVDMTGTGNNGMAPGGVAFGPAPTGVGAGGNGMAFVDPNGVVIVGEATDTSVDTASQFTIAAWVRPTDTSGNHTIVTKAPASGIVPPTSVRIFELYLDGNGVVVRFGSDSFTSTSALPLDTWTHVALTFNGASQQQLYIDGVLDQTAMLQGANEAGSGGGAWDLRVGNGVSGAVAGPFVGQIDEVLFFPRLLVDTEIATIATSGPSGL
jgi:hypothetical protein